MAYRGIDISEWQGNVDFQQVKQAVDFIILREGVRQRADNRFFEYVNGAKAVKLPILAAYHFMYSINDTEAVAEAKSCLANLKKAGIGKGCTIFADYEYDSVKKAAARGVTITKALCTSMTKAFCDTIRAAGYAVGIYTNQDYYNRMYEVDIWNHYSMWLADYRGTAPAHPCPFHQTSSKGSIPGINGPVDTDLYYAPAFPDNLLEGQKTTQPAQNTKPAGNGITGQSLINRVCSAMTSWIGATPGSAKHRDILNTYNSYRPLARGYAVQVNDAYCATTVSAAFIKAGIAKYTGTECGVDQFRQIAVNKGMWIENDAYKAQPGDAVIYDWDDNGAGDNKGYPEHIGLITESHGSYFVVTEGNMGNNGIVGQRRLNYNGRYIRGFIHPDYDAIAQKMGGTATPKTNTPEKAPSAAQKSIDELAKEVIAGKWGNAPGRPQRLTAAGYDANAVQARVNQILAGNSSNNAQQAVYYIVQAGDTLSAIASRYGTTWQKVAALSGLKNPNLIYPGQKLRIK